MKKSYVFLPLLAVAFFTQSFKPTEPAKTPIAAQVNGKSFALKAENTYTAQIAANKTAVISFNGADLPAKDGYAQEQKLNLEYKINEVGDILVKTISYEIDGKKFQNIPDATSTNVTRFEWSSDKKSFIISANFDCKAQSDGPFQSNNDPVEIKGSVENIIVNVSGSDMATITE